MVTMNTRGAVMQESTVVVGRGEVKVSRDNTTILACLGLGSCVLGTSKSGTLLLRRDQGEMAVLLDSRRCRL